MASIICLVAPPSLNRAATSLPAPTPLITPLPLVAPPPPSSCSAASLCTPFSCPLSGWLLHQVSLRISSRAMLRVLIAPAKLRSDVVVGGGGVVSSPPQGRVVSVADCSVFMHSDHSTAPSPLPFSGVVSADNLWRPPPLIPAPADHHSLPSRSDRLTSRPS